MPPRVSALAGLAVLGLLAPACDGDPPDSDATFNLHGGSAHDDELWLAPGHGR